MPSYEMSAFVSKKSEENISHGEHLREKWNVSCMKALLLCSCFFPSNYTCLRKFAIPQHAQTGQNI